MALIIKMTELSMPTTLEDAATEMEEMRERIAYLEHELVEAKLQAASARSNEDVLTLKTFQMTSIIAALFSMIVQDDEDQHDKQDMSCRRIARWRQIVRMVRTKLHGEGNRNRNV